jgi:O-antigen ligase
MTFDETINKRLNTENNVVSQLLNGDIAQVPYTSIGIRINSWIAASEWISERPLTGWGPKGRDLVMSETSWLPDWVLMQYGHLHNYFLETWVEYGLIGLVAMCLLTIWIGRATWLAWQRDELPNDMAIFGIIFFFYWITINQFESYNSFPSGQFVHNLVVGGLITHYWKSKKSLTTKQC